MDIKGTIIAGYFWVLFFVTTVGFTTLNALVMAYYALTGQLRDQRTVSSRIHKIATIWARSILALMPGWLIRVEGREHLPDSNTACVIVANHESATDILAMYYVGMQFRWLAKKEVFRVPFMGSSMKWAGYVSIDRADRDSSRKALETSTAWIKRSIPMFFFPEGTRSTSGHVGKFKFGAFKLAYDTQVPVLPICIKGAGRLMEKGRGRPQAATVFVRILPTMTIYPGESVEEFTQRVRDEIKFHHERLGI